MPDVPKRSAGYHAAPDMDLIDLFIGAEGTLGVITEITLRVLDPAPARCLALVSCPAEGVALAIVAALRECSERTWRTRDPHGLDVAAIEQLDRRSVALLREDGADVRHDVRIGPEVDTLLLLDIELSPRTTAEDVYEQIEAYGEDGGGDGPIVRLCRLLDGFGLLDAVELAAPGEARRAAQLIGVREAVPAGGERSASAREAHQVDARIAKTAADMIVPFAAFGEMLDDLPARLRVARARLRHLGPRLGRQRPSERHPALLRRRRGGQRRDPRVRPSRSPGSAAARSPSTASGGTRVKQALLRQLYGDAGIEEMRAVKRAHRSRLEARSRGAVTRRRRRAAGLRPHPRSPPALELLERDLGHGGNPARPIVEPLHELQGLAAGSPELLESDVPDFVDRLQAVGNEAWTNHHDMAHAGSVPARRGSRPCTGAATAPGRRAIDRTSGRCPPPIRPVPPATARSPRSATRTGRRYRRSAAGCRGRK